MRRLAILLLLSSALAGSALAADPPRRFVVFFQEWSAAIDDTAQSVVTEAADFAKAHPRSMVQVHGYADPVGSRQANVLMSQLRAQRVSDQLLGDGIPASRIRQDGHGPVKFAISSQESRRVVVEIAGGR
jgi:outer membrane protein OmpA-like peptidoglycan-associated protein